MADGFFTDMPIFSDYPDTSLSNWWKNAKNWLDINADNTVSPIKTSPIGNTRGFVSALEWEPYYHEVSQNKKQQQPVIDPEPDPQKFPVVSPTPVPDPVTTPLPQPIIDPVDVKPIVKPTPDPVDPDPYPVDPDPIIIPPDPDKPTPDPTQPEPDPDEPDDPDDDDDEGDMVFDLSEFFPFCLPKDLYLAMKMLACDDQESYFHILENGGSSDVTLYDPLTSDIPDPLTFDFPVTFHLSGLGQEDINYNFELDIIHPVDDDLPGAEPYVKYLRFFLLFIYIVFLIFASIKLIPR
ncbi:MAG: hypothetical protein J5829_10615 [Lachnospiraceae bacterium]|nr:hypothetical protein [Lachnospiraceae bacterium]